MMDYEDRAVGVLEWMITFILSSLPVIGLIMLIVWAFGSNTKKSKKNWAIATLIFMVLGIVLWFIFIGSLINLSTDIQDVMNNIFNR